MGIMGGVRTVDIRKVESRPNTGFFSLLGWGDNWVFQKKVKFFFAHPGNG
jgi:hypothetical protein